MFSGADGSSPHENITLCRLYHYSCSPFALLYQEYHQSFHPRIIRMTKLTSHLLSHSSSTFQAATQHAWLKLAGTSQLSRPALLAWLTQDRLYALTYPTFIGALLSKISLPSTASRTSTLEWRICNLLIDSLTNIRRELGMFEDVLRQEFGWAEGGEVPRQETRAYADVFAGASRASASLLEGLVVLWATEKCYLEAWKYAKAQSGDRAREDGEEDVLQKTLIPNWTSEEFETFVDTIGDLVNELGEDAAQGEWTKAEEAWRQVLWAEERFWPEV